MAFATLCTINRAGQDFISELGVIECQPRLTTHAILESSVALQCFNARLFIVVLVPRLLFTTFFLAIRNTPRYYVTCFQLSNSSGTKNQVQFFLKL
jgi:hypothetical protein